MAAETLINVTDPCFHCCSKCKGLFSNPDDHLKHQLVCNGNPFKSTSMQFACERKIYLQLFQTEDFQSDGNYSQPNMSKDDSFIDHVVKVRMPQDLVDPSIFLRTNNSSNLQIPLFDSTHLEPDVNKENNYLQQANKPRFSESIEPDQLRKIINKNIDYLKSDDITALTSQTNKELTFPPSQGEPRLLSPIEKHFLPDGPKSRVQSPFEKCMNYLQDTGAGYQTGSLTYASNQSIPFSCNLTTDLLGGLTSGQDENLTSVDELPTLQYLDLAKKDVFLGQNPGLSQMNTKDPFLINATVRPERPLSATPRYPIQVPPQSTKSCEDLSSPTFPLQDSNYFNFPSTLDEPTQLDYLDLATLDLLTNPSSFGTYGMGTFRNDRFAEDREDIYSECNFLFHDQNYYATDNVEKSEKQSFEENVKLKKSKIKRLSLKKVKRGIEKKNKASVNKKNSTELNADQKVDSDHKKQQTLSESLPERPVNDMKRLKRTYSAEYEQIKPSPLSRKRKIMSSADTLNFRISPEAKRKVKTDRKFNESQRLCPTNTILNVKDSLVGFTEEEKKSMTAVIGTMGCIIVKKQKSGGRADLRSDQIITEVSTGSGDNQLFVLDGKNLQTYDTSPAKRHSDQNLHLSPGSSGSGNQSENVKSVLKLKCQLCSFKTTSVTEFQEHQSKHDEDEDEDEIIDVESTVDDVNTTCSEVHMAQTLRHMHFRSSSVDNPSDSINTLENSVFADESAYYKESTENGKYPVDNNVNQAEMNPERRQSIEQLDETLLELCNQIDVESLSDSPPFATQPAQCFTDVVQRPEATEVPIANGRNLFDTFQNDQCFQTDQKHTYIDVVSTQAPMVEPILTAPSSSVQMNFSSENMFCTSASMESLGSDVIYTAQVLPTQVLPIPVVPTPQTDDHSNAVNRYQLPPTFDSLAQQNDMMTSMVPEASINKQLMNAYVSRDNYDECKMIPEGTTTNTVNLYLDPAPEQIVDTLAAYVDTLTTEKVDESQTETKSNSESIVSIANSMDLKMVSEETQTVDICNSFVRNPLEISMFDQTNTLCISNEKNHVNTLVSAPRKQDAAVQSNIQVSLIDDTNQSRLSAFERVSSSSKDSVVQICVEGVSSRQNGMASVTENEVPVSRQVPVPKILSTNSSQTDPNGNILASSSTHTNNQQRQTKSYEYPIANRVGSSEMAPALAVSTVSTLPVTPPKSESSSRSVVVKVDLKTNNVTVSEILDKGSHDPRLSEMGSANLHSVIKEEKLTYNPAVTRSNQIQGKDAEQFTSIKTVESPYRGQAKKNGRRSRSEEVVGGCRAKLPRSTSTLAVQDHCYHTDGLLNLNTPSYHFGAGSKNTPGYNTNSLGKTEVQQDSHTYLTNSLGRTDTSGYHKSNAGVKYSTGYNTGSSVRNDTPDYHTSIAGSKDTLGYYTNDGSNNTGYLGKGERKDTPGYNTNSAVRNEASGYQIIGAVSNEPPGYKRSSPIRNEASGYQANTSCNLTDDAERKKSTGSKLNGKVDKGTIGYDTDVAVIKETCALQTDTVVRKNTCGYPTASTSNDTPGMKTIAAGCKDIADSKTTPSQKTTAEINKPNNKDVNKTDDGVFMCDDCGYKTSRKSNFKAHTVKHNGVELSCSVPECDFKTVHKRCLNFHLLKHNSEYRLLCDQCPFTTTDAKSLRRHMQIKHYHQYRFKCPDCDHLSMFRERVANHYRNTHLQQKHFACNQCDYRTGYTHLLKFHLMAHAGIRPYKCSACDYQVNNVNKVTRHIKTRHKGQTGISCEKLDLNFEVDTKQFQCEEKTCDKDINVIELTEEQVAEIVEKRLAKQEKCLQAKTTKPDIPVFDPKTMQPKKMVSLLPANLKSPEKLTKETGTVTVVTNTCDNNNPRTNVVQIPIAPAAKIVTMNNNLVIKRQSLDDSHLARSTSGYKGMENIWTSIKTAPQKTTSTVSVIKNETTLDFNVNELDSGYRCSMCEYKLESHEDIANHLLVCKMERHKLN